ncbi:MAG: hypothetical protein ACI8PQ_001308 [Planctomycetota bacterium]|jgi:hypothetical protein
MYRALLLAASFLHSSSAPTPETTSLVQGLVQEQVQELVDAKGRRNLRKLVIDFARLGLGEEVQELREILFAMGDSEEDQARLERRWTTELEEFEGGFDGRALGSLAKKFVKQVASLERSLGELPPEDQRPLAEVLLRLNSESKGAHLALGATLVDGRWYTPRGLGWLAGSTRINELVRAAQELEIRVEHGASGLPLAVELYGDGALQVSSHGVTLHGGIDAVRLERVLRATLRAAAFSNAVVDGELAVPKFPIEQHHLFVRNTQDYTKAFESCFAAGSISPIMVGTLRAEQSESFPFGVGLRCSGWRTEARYQALVLWDLLTDWLGGDAQPCFVAGHLNWLCLNFFGTSMPSVSWREQLPQGDARSSVREQARRDALWRSAQQTLFGCRSWIIQRIELGHSISFVRAVQPELGMITDEPLLVGTLVNEYLQASGPLRSLFENSRAKGKRLEEVESALEQAIPDFEREWVEWLLGNDLPRGITQRVFSPAASDTASDTGPDANALAILGALKKVRDVAHGKLAVFREEFQLSAELSAGAQAHAHYLALNPKQAKAWPDAHEEYAEFPGFTPAGAWSGSHSVIHEIVDPVQAISDWMGTFYHRLPLLEMGLVGIGYGQDDRFTVLDTNSLVVPYWAQTWVLWPARDARNVPRAFVPELPNPVPGEDQSAWGYPITLQAYWGESKQTHHMEMSLFRGENTSGEAVDCHYLTPHAPAFDKLAPKDAFCLIPKQRLRPETTYTVQAHCVETGQSQAWSFRTAR